MSKSWHLITSEFPPDVCGVGDQSFLLARGLVEAGDEVHVYTRKTREAPPVMGGVHLNQIFENYGSRDLKELGKRLDCHPAPRRVLVQWVPHGYGFRSLNLPFAFWLFRRGRAGADAIELIVHEPGLGLTDGGGRHLVAALIHRAMLWLALRHARRCWVTIPAWKERVRPYARRDLEIGWLPATSPIPVVEDHRRVLEIRDRFAPSSRLVGVFGKRPTAESAFGMAIGALLESRPDVSFLLLGSESREAAKDLQSRHRHFASRIHATGALPPSDVSLAIQACDVMLQLYPDGISARRSSLIASLANGAAIVTNEGRHSEGIWRKSDAVTLVPYGDPSAIAKGVADLIGDPAQRQSLARKAERLFASEFHISHGIRRLRQGTSP